MFSCTSRDVPSFVEKYPKIKYAIFDRPHNLGMELCETSFIDWIVLKLGEKI
jgi:hypothetical protein